MAEFSGVRAELRLHPDVHSIDDEWSGITDPKVRRKLQNRLNQRAARRRKAARKNAPDEASSSSSGASRAATIKDMPIHQRFDLFDLVTLRRKVVSRTEWKAAAESLDKMGQSAFVSIRSKNACQRWYEVLLENRVVPVRSLAEQLANDQDNAWMYPLPSDHLISLVYYNVYRALIANVQMLGLDVNLMYTDDYPSPFLPLSPTSTSNIRNLPPSLQPTELQKAIAHHPQWDIFPDPVVRDNILRYGEENIDDNQLCFDMVGNGDYLDKDNLDTQQKNGLIVWAEPWDPEGWEATETFVCKWPFLFRGALNAQNSTNRWRIQRGEPPLDFARILEIE